MTKKLLLSFILFWDISRRSLKMKHSFSISFQKFSTESAKGHSHSRKISFVGTLSHWHTPKCIDTLQRPKRTIFGNFKFWIFIFDFKFLIFNFLLLFCFYYFILFTFNFCFIFFIEWWWRLLYLSFGRKLYVC